jgi:hypothetical protein
MLVSTSAAYLSSTGISYTTAISVDEVAGAGKRLHLDHWAQHERERATSLRSTCPKSKHSCRSLADLRCSRGSYAHTWGA